MMDHDASDNLSPARRRVLECLKMQGQATAGALASRLEMTDVAIRQHLAGLDELGLVRSETGEAVGRGRPPIVWSLTDRASMAFPDSHAELTVGLISAMRRAIGEKAMLRVLDVRSDDQVEAYLEQMPPARASLKRRVETLAEIRTREGYMADVIRDGRHAYLLIENHCPICEAAKSCVGICANELDVFQRVLGPDTLVERTEHLMNDDHRCVYRVTMK